jgi:hypothetical protein
MLRHSTPVLLGPDTQRSFVMRSLGMPAKRTTRSKTSKRTTIEPHKGDRRYVRRNKKGQFKKEVNVGRSLAADRRRKSNRKVKPGQGDGGDTAGGIIRAVKRVFGQ